MRIDSPNGKGSRCRSTMNPVWRPRVRAAASSAPMPANAICPRDSWPAQPVSTVSDNAQIAKQPMSAYRSCREGAVITKGTTTANAKSTREDDEVEPLDPPHVAEVLGDLTDLRRERERLGLLPVTAAALERNGDEHRDQEEEVDRARACRGS